MDAGSLPIMTYGGAHLDRREPCAHRILPSPPDRSTAAPPQILQDHLKLPDHGPKCRAGPLLTLLFYAAAPLTSLSDACKSLRDAPSDEAARLALIATLPDFAELHRRLNAALAGNLPADLAPPTATPGLRPRLDPLSWPAPARPRRDLPLPGQERHQPLPRLRHALRHPPRLPLHRGLDGRLPRRALEEVLKRLLRQAAAVGIRCRLLLLDRGFYSVGVIRYLQAARHPFLMPVICRGRKLDDPRGPSGTNVFLTWEKSGFGTYTLHDAQKRSARVSICVKCRYYRGQWRRHGKQRLIYAFWGVQPPSFDWVQGDLSPAVRHRDDLPAVASGADSDHDPRSGAAAVVRGDRSDLAERLGVVAPDGAGPAAARQSRDPLGLAPLPQDVAVVGACGGAEARRPRLGHDPTLIMIKDCSPR